MKTKKILTANLKPGMVSCEAAYTFTNHLVIQSNTTLTPEIIEKLKYYAVKAVKVYIAEEGDDNNTVPSAEDSTISSITGIDLSGPTYFERVQQSESFQNFRENYTVSVDHFKQGLNDIVTRNSTEVIDEMLNEVDNILSRTRNSLHLFDMLQCLRGFDDLTYMHSMNVSLICTVIGNWLNLPTEELNILSLCGLLHDIGKLKIPPDIIAKPGKLTDDEFKLIQSHPKMGYDILRSKDLDNRIKLAALQHHERYDGSGYPRQLTGPEISNFSSIVAIADVYDAMTSNRVYRKGICPFKVIATFEKDRELFEPSILYTFMRRTIEAYVNTEVMLSNGEKGKVILLNQNLLSRPVVITDKKTYDLSRDFSIDIDSLI